MERAAPLGAESISLARQCALVGLARSSWYYQPKHAGGESEENLEVKRLLDEQYTRTPFYGIRRMTAWLRTQGQAVTPKRVGRLLRLMGLEAIYPKPRLSGPAATAQRYPYLLRGLLVERPNQVWSTDMTYVPMRRGCLYLVAVLDWYSRSVLSWEVSNTLDTGFCLAALEAALTRTTPEIFNTDQGTQFTSHPYTSRLEQAHVRIIPNHRRWLENPCGTGGRDRSRPYSGMLQRLTPRWYQLGRTGAGIGQHLRGAAVAFGQIGGGVPAFVRDSA